MKAFWQPKMDKPWSKLEVHELFAVGAGLKAGLEQPDRARECLAEVEAELSARGRKLELEDLTDA